MNQLAAISFLTPEAGIAVSLAVVPLVALAFAQRRGARARSSLGLGRNVAPGAAVHAGALVLVFALVALAATQPVWSSRASVPVRSDVEAWVVLDTSRSMLASAAPGSPTRIDRARAAALRIREELPGVPFGIASLTDRALPHLFPSPDRKVFAATLARAIRTGHPPPALGGATASSVSALAALPRENFFRSPSGRRVVVALTDAESSELDVPRLDDAFARQPRPDLVVVRIGRSGEAVFDVGGRPEAEYTPVSRAPFIADRLAALAGGRVFTEDAVEGAARAVADLAGRSGPTELRGEGESRRPLAPYAALAAALPLGVILRRRNFP